jgi:hypothetical protein
MSVAPLAHIVQGSPLPVALGWAAAALIAAGGVAIFRGRGTVVEGMGWAAFALGFCGAGAVVLVTAVLPQSARISISLAQPTSGPVSSPLNVSVCGRVTATGAPAAAPDGNDVLAVLIDGREAATEKTATFALVVPPGRHRLRVELLTIDHYVFSPPVIADATVTVTGTQPLASWRTCPSR